MQGREVPNDVRLAAALSLAAQAYRAGHVRLANRHLGNRATLVASRQGVYAVSHEDHVLLAHGLFFGATIRDGDIYLFEACGEPATPSAQGRIVRLRRQGDHIVCGEVLADGLDNGCHQIDFIGDRLCVVDTYNQQIMRFAADFSSRETIQPLAIVRRPRDWTAGYVHCNAMLQVDDRILLLLHNGGLDRDSEIAVLDRDWQRLDTLRLPGRSCHHLAMLDDGTLLSCGSMKGELISADGFHLKVSSMLTRGLCVSDDEIAIGASRFAIRRERIYAPGTVTFLDRAYRRRAVLELPTSPTEIRRLEGKDFGLSRTVGA